MLMINNIKIAGIIALLGSNAPSLESIDLRSLEGVSMALVETGENLAVSVQPLIDDALGMAKIEAQRNGIHLN
jgi:hypothetical protein